MIEQLKTAMIDAQRSGAANTAELQQEYDLALQKERYERHIAERQRMQREAASAYGSTLGELEQIGAQYDGPVGRCSDSHAKWLGMAAAVAGGAVWVNIDPWIFERVGHARGGLLCAGDMAVQERLDTDEVFAKLLAETRRMVGVDAVLLHEQIDEHIAVLGWLAGQ